MFRIRYSEIASETVLGRKQSTIVTATCSIFAIDNTFGKPCEMTVHRTTGLVNSRTLEIAMYVRAYLRNPLTRARPEFIR